jgi:hypothetical protein
MTDRCHGQKEKDEATRNYLQTTHRQLQIEKHEPH